MQGLTSQVWHPKHGMLLFLDELPSMVQVALPGKDDESFWLPRRTVRILPSEQQFPSRGLDPSDPPWRAFLRVHARITCHVFEGHLHRAVGKVLDASGFLYPPDDPGFVTVGSATKQWAPSFRTRWVGAVPADLPRQPKKYAGCEYWEIINNVFALELLACGFPFGCR